jgi:ethanolamine utilization protein EutA
LPQDSHSHTHDHDHDHDHDHGEADETIEDNPIWQQDNVTLHSVGIDIGSSGTQIAFSRLHLRRLGEDLASRYIVVERETLFQSDVQLTPYKDESLIDAEALGAIIDRAYEDARQRPREIDTGVVILTGEALRRRNAGRIAEIVAVRAGDLVCASAGHHMEARLAAYGSGAVFKSHTDQSRILNIDIGGGTTKLALIDRGRVLTTAAFHVGGRLQVVDQDGRIVRLAPAGRAHAQTVGLSWNVGDTASSAELDRVAEVMADAVVSATSGTPHAEEVASLFLTDPIDDYGQLDGMMFSGGVAEYVYERETRDFDDLGRRLGLALRRRIDDGAFAAALLPAGECIRATVLGASEYSVQLSGNTCYISAPEDLLPRRNLQVIHPHYELSETVDSSAVAQAITSHLKDFDADTSVADVALALEWDGAPAYERISEFARGIANGLASRIARGLPVYLLFDADIARTLGSILKDELGVASDLLVIDGVRFGDFDYIDLGDVRWPSNTVPVTIKTLIFVEDARTDPLPVPATAFSR